VICRQCGTEIADKAIVCYRCGRSTAEPAGPSGAGQKRPAGFGVISLAALLILVIAGLYMGTTATGQLPRAVAWVLSALGVLILGWRLLRRR
jgi:hypothetical protein